MIDGMGIDRSIGMTVTSKKLMLDFFGNSMKRPENIYMYIYSPLFMNSFTVKEQCESEDYFGESE